MFSAVSFCGSCILAVLVTSFICGACCSLAPFEQEDPSTVPYRAVSKIVNSNPVDLVVCVFLTASYSVFPTLLSKERQVVYLLYPDKSPRPMDIGNRREAFNDRKLYVAFLDDDASLEDSFASISSLFFWKPKDKILIVRKGLAEQAVDRFYRTYATDHWTVNVYFLKDDGAVMFRDVLTNGPTVLLPDKFYDVGRDLNHRAVLIAMFPGVAAEPHQWGNKTRYMRRDGMTSEIIVGSVRGRFEYVSPDDGDTFGNANATYIGGVLKQVHSGAAHASFNSRFLMDEYRSLVDFTYPHDRDELVIMVPVAEPVPQDVTSILPLAVTISLFATLVAYGIYLKTTGLSYSEVLLEIVLVSTGRSARQFESACFRAVFVATVVPTFEISSYFQGQLVSLLSVPRKPDEIKTLREFAESGMPLYSWTEFGVTLNASLENGVKEKLMRNLKYVEHDAFDEGVRGCARHAYVTTSKMANQHFMYIVTKLKKKCYYQIEQRTVPILMSFIVNYGSPLTDVFDVNILRMIEGGIQEYWEKRYDAIFSLSDVDANPAPKKIALRPLAFAFGMFGVGLGAATAAFAVEISLRKIKSTRSAI